MGRDLLEDSGRARFERQAVDTGAALYRSLIPESLRPRLRQMPRGAPLLISSRIHNIPWELMYDGEAFWGLRYALGNHIHYDDYSPSHPLDRPIRKALVIGSDASDEPLGFMREEVEIVTSLLRAKGVQVKALHGSEAGFARVLRHLARGYDLLHYCGHIGQDMDGNASLLLHDVLLGADLAARNLTGQPIVFLNGCSRQGKGDFFASITHAFLRGNQGSNRASCVIASMSEIADRHAVRLAESLYEKLLSGETVGEALRSARDLGWNGGDPGPTWLSYTLHGHPVERRPIGPPPEGGEKPVLWDLSDEPRRDAWLPEGRAILVSARRWALSRSADRAFVMDVVPAVLESDWFGNTVVPLLPPFWSRGALSAAIRHVLRVRGPLRPLHGPVRKEHFDSESHRVFDHAAETERLPIGPRSLFLALLRSGANPVEKLLGDLGMEASWVARAVESVADGTRDHEAGQPEDAPHVHPVENPSTSPAPAPVPDPPPAPAPDPAPDPVDRPPESRGRDLFDEYGVLDVARVTPEALSVLCDGAALTDAGARIDLDGLAIALVRSPRVLRLGRVELDAAPLIAQLLSAVLHRSVGAPATRNARSRVPERREFTREALDAIREAVEEGRLDLVRLRTAVGLRVWPRIEVKICAIHPDFAKSVRALLLGPDDARARSEEAGMS